MASGRGFACVARDGGNGWVAMAADVDVNQDTGQVVVKRLVVACDAGPISNPDGIRNQLEGAALHGISRTLAEEVTWDDQKVTAVDWQTYRTLSLGTPMPVVETVLMDRPTCRPPAPAKRRSPASPPRSATRSSTPPASGFARCRSRPSG